MNFKVYWTVAGYCTIAAETEDDADAKVAGMTAGDLLAMTDHTSTSTEYELDEEKAP